MTSQRSITESTNSRQSSSRLRSWFIPGVVGLLGLSIGLGAGWFWAGSNSSAMIGSTLVLGWGDGLHDNQVSLKAFYGALVFLDRANQGYVASARIYIGQPDGLGGYYHNCGVIGHARSFEEAHAKWGKVNWTREAVYFGDPNAGGHKVERSVFQRHR